MCIFDGTPLVSVKSKSIPISVTSPTGESKLKPAPWVVKAAKLHLINKNLGLDLKIKDGDIIGRTTGRFVNIFSKYRAVSGEHAQFKSDPEKGWIVTDLDSTNGTKYNNTPLKPMQSQSLSNKSYLQIANIEFYVEILGKKSTGKTGTLRI